MKKSLMLLLALAVLLGAFLLEGGTLPTLFIGSALVPMLLGPLVSAMFSFSLSEIGDAFSDAWSERADQGRADNYQRDLLVIRNLQSSVVSWAATIFILAVIMILSVLGDPKELGPHVAMALLAFLYAFGLRALLFTPMENSILKSIGNLAQVS